jgi:pimeloyl-ACP methyl ester carboxylesterase
VQHPADYPAARLADMRLGVPVRIYTGGRSHPGFHRVAEVLAAALPTVEIVAIPDATHDVQRAPAFNAALLSVTDPA